MSVTEEVISEVKQFQNHGIYGMLFQETRDFSAHYSVAEKQDVREVLRLPQVEKRDA